MRWLAIILAFALAGCGKPQAALPDGQMAFSREGAVARLTYRVAGRVRYVLGCEEGSDHADLSLQPRPLDRQPVTLGAGRGDDTSVELRMASWPDGTFRFHLEDSFLSRLLWDGDIWLNGERLRVARGGETANARWRFHATCASVPATLAAWGEPAPRSLYDLMARLKVEEAAADARQALARGDQRLVTVTGYARVAPGAPDGWFPEPGTFRDIDLTYDVIRSDEQNALKDRARRYAEIYNPVVLARKP
jgi:hypothetical protein